MKRVIIVSKTRMRGDHVCVGGHDLNERMRSLRLLQPDGTNMPADARFEIGHVWELDYQPAPDVQPPHVEDVLVDPSGARHRRIRYVGVADTADRIEPGTLVRVSLARPWAPSNAPRGLYLQISGWYAE